MSVNFTIRHCKYQELPLYGKNHLFSWLDDGVTPSPFFKKGTDPSGLSSFSSFMDREHLSHILRVYNTEYGYNGDERIWDDIAKDACFIVSGHQPVLMTGPLYIFYKAVSIIALARELQKRCPYRIIPLFWVAAEDHDIMEVNHFYFNGMRFTFKYEAPLITGQVPQVADISLVQCRDLLLQFLDSHMPESEFSPWVRDMIASSSFDNYASLFISLLIKLFSAWGLIVVNPLWIRSLTSQVLAHMVDGWGDASESLVKGGEILKKHRFSPPLNRLGIFEIVNGKRKALSFSEDGIIFDHGKCSFTEGAERIKENPDSFSGNVALRPIVQDAVIPCLLTVGGPSELLYLWQISPLYDVMHITRSSIFPRISGTIIENKIKRILLKMNMYDQLPSIFSKDSTILNDRRPKVDMNPDIMKIEESVKEMMAAIGKVSAGKENKRWVEKEKDMIEKRIVKLISRLKEEELEEIGLGKSRLERIKNALIPGGKPQERVANIFQYLVLYGPDFIEASLESLDPFSLQHHLVEIESA
ncbi:MAG: bacillithiol biosynthesis cysteine-adding enzyme BshC [bacterium]